MDSIAELEERAAQERLKTFRKYGMGREQIIDIWEDPVFENYRVDRYGFIHTEALPAKLNPLEEKEIFSELQREVKWLKMLRKWNKKETQEKLKKRIFKGIPSKLRTEVWKKLFNIEKSMQDNPRVYARMLDLAEKYSTDVRQIDSDVNRCFRDHVNYRERYSIKQQSLFNVLAAYSMYNMEVGYCQGMSTIAGVLLMFFDEEETFWALSTLLADKKYAMHGLFIEGFPKLMRFLKHHDRILTKYLPKLKKHFDKQGLDSVLYSLKWFFVIFIERIPFSLCLRVLDVYFLYGERVVTSMAFTILKMHRDKLLKFKDMDQITEYLQFKLNKNFGYSDNYTIKTLEDTMNDLKSAKLDLPPPAEANEFPKVPFGQYIEPSLEKKIGLRKSIFTETEKTVTEYVITRNDENENVEEDESCHNNKNDENADDNLSIHNTVTIISDCDPDVSYIDDDIDDIDEITYTNSNNMNILMTHSLNNSISNHRSLTGTGTGTGTSITSMSDDQQSIGTLNQQFMDDDDDDNEEDLIRDPTDTDTLVVMEDDSPTHMEHMTIKIEIHQVN